MLETIRDYAAARLLEAGEAAGAQARHFGFFARAVDRRPGEDEDSYCERLRADYDNIRVALGWASRQDDPELLLGLVTRLVVFWSASTHLAEAVQWLRSATERGRDADPGLRARALGALTQIASLALDLPVAFAAGTEGLAVLRQLGDKEGIVMTLTSLGSSATQRASRGGRLPDEAIALAEEIDDQRALAYALAMRGRAANTFPADRPAGREALRRSIEVARQCGARHVEGIALGNLGVLSSLDGRPRDAIPPLTEALPLLREAGDVYFLSLTLIGLVQSLSLTGDYDAALAPCQELDSISGQLGAAQLYFAPCARGFAGLLPRRLARGHPLLPRAARLLRAGTHGRDVGRPPGLGRVPRRPAGDGPAPAGRVHRVGRSGPHLPRPALGRPGGDRAGQRRARAGRGAGSAGGRRVAGRSVRPEHRPGVPGRRRCRPGRPRPARTGRPAGRGPGGLRGRRGDEAAADRPRAHRSRPADLPGDARPRPLRRSLVARSGPDTRRGGRLRHPRPRPPVAARAGLGSLTPTELTVAQAVAEGLSNPQIATRMFISRRTVTTHLTSIFHKLGISSRTELAARAARREDREHPDSRPVTPRGLSASAKGPVRPGLPVVRQIAPSQSVNALSTQKMR